MNPSKAVIPAILCVAGLAAGYGAKKSTAPQSSETAQLLAMAKEVRRSNRDPSTSTTYIPPEVKSTDTVDSLIGKGESATFNDLATWLLTASSEEIGAYWAACKDLKPHKFSRNLVFMNWTRIDPEGALAATSGTEDEEMAWWGWASNDPAAALSAVGSEFLGSVTNSIGQHHPQWLRDHFDEIPEAGQGVALNGLTTWKEDSDHVATLDFLREHGRSYSERTLKTFIRKDPWAAYDWLEKNDMLFATKWGRSPGDTLIQTMLENHPEDLERLSAMTPPGRMKWRMEAAIFENLLSTDIDAALKNARETEAPLIAATRLAEIGKTYVESDPEKAFALAAEILESTNGSLSPALSINTNNGGTDWGADYDSAEKFMSSLLNEDPERVMDMLAGSDLEAEAFTGMSQEWADTDVDAYASWATRQDDPEVRSEATDHIVSSLAQQDRFEEAGDWALSDYSATTGGGSMYRLVHFWKDSDPDGAAQWVDRADISDAMRSNLHNLLRRR